MNRSNTNNPVGFVGVGAMESRIVRQLLANGYKVTVYARDRTKEIEAGMPASRWVERKLQHPVMKAFNNIYAQHLMKLGLPVDTPEHGQLIAGGSR
jgi:predicted dinucleotide-binding enzyme